MIVHHFYMIGDYDLMKRANSVGMALVERGVNIDNIWIDGMGETEPITLNGTAKEMLLNRRVDIAVTK